MTKMPLIDIDSINFADDRERNWVNGIITTQGSNKGCLRTQVKTDTPEVKYIWRMVAFFVSPIQQHHCMPWGADFDLFPVCKRDNSVVSEYSKILDVVVDKVVDTIPKNQWAGVKAWHRAFC